MQRAQLQRRPPDAGAVATLRPPSGETRAYMANALLMSAPGVRDEKSGQVSARFVRHGRVPIHVLRVLDLLIAQVYATDDTEFYEYRIGATHLYRQFGIQYYPSPTEIERLVQETKAFTSVVRSGSKIAGVSWISVSEYDKETCAFRFKLSDELKPYLLDLQRDYTAFRVRDLLRLKSHYAHRLYQIVSRFEPLTRKADHKLLLAAFSDALHLPVDHGARVNWKRLRREIVRPAIDDLRDLTGLLCSVRPVREHGRLRGPVVAVEIGDISYQPELVQELEKEDESSYGVMLRAIARVTQRSTRQVERDAAKKESAASTHDIHHWMRDHEHCDPFADG